MTRLGFVYPGGGAETDYYRFAEAHGLAVFLVGSRIPGGDDHDVAALREVARIEHVVEAARRLDVMRVDAVAWACTSGSFILGRRFAEAQAAALHEATGKPATSTSLAFVDALAGLGISRVAVLATYPEPASRAFAGFLAEFGISIVRLAWLDAASGFDAANLGRGEIEAALARCDLADAGAVLVPDTALPSLDLVAGLEARSGLPVLTANQVTLWAALGLAGHGPVPDGPGVLFRHSYEGAKR